MLSKVKKFRLSSFQLIMLSFASVIILGALLLMQPFSTQERIRTPFIQALFTATSSVCVTGLVVKDTATYWSTFGHIVIIALIQIGGFGVMTVMAGIAMLSGQKISLAQRSRLQDTISAPQLGGIVRLTTFIIKYTLIIELIGACFMAPTFVRDFGIKGLWYALFHSISAFCNAGFDLLGVREQFSSLTTYVDSVPINVTIMLLIVIGGLGFVTWDDIRTHKTRLSRYRMQSKVILLTTALLILLPALYFFLVEFHQMPLSRRILVSFFQSITPRTAGFNTVDLTGLTQSSQALTSILMLIGGSPGSTAGGMKTSTLAVLLLTAMSVFRQDRTTHAFGRRLSSDTIRTAFTIMVMYVNLFLFSGFFLSLYDKIPLETALFETASAIGTVGLSLGITASLSIPSLFVLIFLMFFGRVGGLTIIFATLRSVQKDGTLLPLDDIAVG
jgi:trk system potassium uptake protein TrkH